MARRDYLTKQERLSRPSAETSEREKMLAPRREGPRFVVIQAEGAVAIWRGGPERSEPQHRAPSVGEGDPYEQPR